MNPRNDWQVVVQREQVVTGPNGSATVPGYVQVDNVTDGNHWSKGPDALRAEGVAVPDFHRLPTGRYTWAEAEMRLWLMRLEVTLGGWCNMMPLRVWTLGGAK